MFKTLKTTIVMIICISMIGSLFAGCASKKEPETVLNNSKTTKSEPLKIKMVNRVSAGYVLEENPVIKRIEELANVKLEIELPPRDTYNDRVNVIAASGDLPDLLYIFDTTNQYPKFANDKLLIPLDEYIGKYPNILANVPKNYLDQARLSTTGKIHSIPRPHTAEYFGAVIRQDWLDRLNLKVPETSEDFLKVLTAFSTQDPDGNGKQDTFGWTLHPGAALVETLLTSAFGIRGNFIPDKNGKVATMEMQPEFLEMLDFYRKLYVEKALDPEWYVNQGNSDSDKFGKGKIGLLSKYVRAHQPYESGSDAIKTAFPGAKFTFMLPLKNKEGKRNVYGVPPTWGAWAITSSAKNPEGIMKFMDWGFSKEGMELNMVGIEGVTFDSFDMKTGIMKSTPEKTKTYKTYVNNAMSFITAIGGVPIVNPGRTPEEQKTYFEDNERYKKEVSYTLHPHINVLAEAVQVTKDNPDLQTKMYSQITKYIVGETKKEDLVQFMDKDWKPVYKKVDEAMQKYYDANLKGK